jgi:hypothetical protein
MNALKNLAFIEILKETTTFFTHIGDFLLKIFYYTPLGVPINENH